MKTRLIVIAAGILLMLAPAHAAFRDLLAGYIASINSVVAVLGKIATENDARTQAAALDTAITAMKTAKTQVGAGATNAAEVDAAVKERSAEMRKITASLHEHLHRVRKNPALAQPLAAALAKLN